MHFILQQPAAEEIEIDAPIPGLVAIVVAQKRIVTKSVL